MSSRNDILRKIMDAGVESVPLPELNKYPTSSAHLTDFRLNVEQIGGEVVTIGDWQELERHLKNQYQNLQRVVSVLPELTSFATVLSGNPHDLESVDLAILKGHFGVAENGAIWITDDQMGDRCLPFISQHLALVIRQQDIVATLQEAYEKIELQSYEYGTFIAGPSKTADIEQSLVLGAHGPKSLLVCLI